MNTKLINKYDLLIDTCSFYTSGNRGFNMNLDMCTYTNPLNSNKCAVGRLLTEKKLRNIEDRDRNSHDIFEISLEKKDFKHKYSSMIEELSFLRSLQKLHNTEETFDIFGLTYLGLQIATNILLKTSIADGMISYSAFYMDKLNTIFAKANSKRQKAASCSN